MPQTACTDQVVESLGVLAEPLRRRLYRYVAAQREEVSRDQAASALGIQRGLAAFHLDKLATAGLLTISFRRLRNRRGPGAGRPAKMYRRSESEYELVVPPRSYRFAAELLATTVEETGADRALFAIAAARGNADAGQALSGSTEPTRQLIHLLQARGFEPFRENTATRLANCPFGELSRAFPALTCGMSHAYLRAAAQRLARAPKPQVGEAAGRSQSRVIMDPAPGRCCVAIFDDEDAG